MGKLEELQKKRDRINNELKKAKAAYEKQGKVIKTKTANLEQVEMDIVSQLLVENNMNMNDLMSMLNGNNQPDTSKETDPIVNIVEPNQGGPADEI